MSKITPEKRKREKETQFEMNYVLEILESIDLSMNEFFKNGKDFRFNSSSHLAHDSLKRASSLLLDIENSELSSILKKLLEYQLSLYDCVASTPSEESIIEENFENSCVSFKSIVGSFEVKQSLFESVVLPLSLSKSIRSRVFQGIRSSCSNILLYGPPGCGKSLLVEACAVEAKSKLFIIKPSDILSKYQGESEKILKQIFSLTSSSRKPVILFFDEFDSIAQTRSTGEEGIQARRLLSELLLQLNAHKAASASSSSSSSSHHGNTQKLIIIAATNRIEDIDEAIIRRFEQRIYVGVLSTKEDRIQLILHFLQPQSQSQSDEEDIDVTGKIEHTLTDENLEYIAEITKDWSCCDIQNLVRDAAMAPIRRGFPMSTFTTSTCSIAVDEDDYEMNISNSNHNHNHDENDTSHRQNIEMDTSNLDLAVTIKDFQQAFEKTTGYIINEESVSVSVPDPVPIPAHFSQS